MTDLKYNQEMKFRHPLVYLSISIISCAIGLFIYLGSNGPAWPIIVLPVVLGAGFFILDNFETYKRVVLLSEVLKTVLITMFISAISFVLYMSSITGVWILIILPITLGSSLTYLFVLRPFMAQRDSEELIKIAERLQKQDNQL